MGECCDGIFFVKTPKQNFGEQWLFYLATAYTAYIKTEFSKFRDFIHEQVFDAVEFYLEWTDGDVAGCGGVDSERLTARTHGAFDYVDE